MTLDPTATIVRASNIISTEVDGETVLFSIQDGHYYGLDPIGSAIWAELAEPVRVDAVCDRMAASHDGDRETIAADTMELLDQLAGLSLVNTVAGA